MSRVNGSHITAAEQKALSQQENAVSKQIAAKSGAPVGTCVPHPSSCAGSRARNSEPITNDSLLASRSASSLASPVELAAQVFVKKSGAVTPQ
jgi:hypothetical protein